MEIRKIIHALIPNGHGTNLKASNQPPMDRSRALPPRVKNDEWAIVEIGNIELCRHATPRTIE
jgi:hypothetical protein